MCFFAMAAGELVPAAWILGATRVEAEGGVYSPARHRLPGSGAAGVVAASSKSQASENPGSDHVRNDPVVVFSADDPRHGSTDRLAGVRGARDV